MKENKCLIVCYSFQLRAYMHLHGELLKNKLNYDVSFLVLDRLAISRFAFRRKSKLFLFDFIFGFFYLLRYRPTLIITMSPKIGLTFQVLAWLLRVEKRAHWFTGQFWALLGKRSLYYKLDKVISVLATHILCDALAQKDFLLDNGIGGGKNILVPGKGSISGIDNKYFVLGLKKLRARTQIFSYKKVCFVGRISAEKRIDKIYEICKKLPNIQFIIAGPLDASKEAELVIEGLKKLENVDLKIGFVDPVEVFSESDFLLAPSDREGFSSVVVEAQAALVTPIATSIYGFGTSIVDHSTGLKFEQSAYVNETVKYLECAYLYNENTLANLSDIKLAGFRHALYFRCSNFKVLLSKAYSNI